MWLWHLRTWFNVENGHDGMWTVGFDDLKASSNINDSVILYNRMHQILNAVGDYLTCQFFKTTVMSIFQ